MIPEISQVRSATVQSKICATRSAQKKIEDRLQFAEQKFSWTWVGFANMPKFKKWTNMGMAGKYVVSFRSTFVVPLHFVIP